MKRSLRVVISASFTAEPVVRPLRLWMERLDIGAEIVMAPYAQVAQELLNPQSEFCRNGCGINVLLLRANDWIRDRSRAEDWEKTLDHLQRSADEFVDHVGGFVEKTSSSILMLFCASASVLPPAYREALEVIERSIIKKVAGLRNVDCVTHAELIQLYPVGPCHDVRADQLAHIPYTDEYFIAIATFLARRIAANVKPPYKVIAVDCDNTLWQGTCGEDGSTGVVVTQAHVRFQQKLVKQCEHGVLLCLCSKNNASDVEEVFQHRTDMPLRSEHIVASRVNWKPKSDNLVALARELNLSLNSFIFVDDDALECEQVRSSIPAVLTLNIPVDQEGILHFVEHVWAFDCIEVSEDAKARTQKYRENITRRLAMEMALDLDRFLVSLELCVEVSKMRDEHLTRVAELVQRTNQFNLTTVRRRSAEIDALCVEGGLECLVVHVRDRFGDYGLVGVVLIRRPPLLIDVDTFLLSCRVLGRGVEERVLSEIGRIAARENRVAVELRYRRTERNRPAWDFLQTTVGQFRESVATECESQTEKVFRVPTEYAKSLQRRSTEGVEAQGGPSPKVEPGPPLIANAEWHDNAYRLSQVSQLLREFMPGSVGAQGTSRVTTGRTATEATLAAIFAEVIGLSDVDVRTGFCDLGGNSLLAVQVIVRVAEVLGFELSLLDFIEASTVEGIAKRLETASQSGPRIEPVERSGPAPLSYAQEGLWFLDQVGLAGPAYNATLVIRLSGDLDEGALGRSFTELVRRHESLRTRFAAHDGVPHQVIDSPDGIPLHRVDLSHIVDPVVLEQELRERMLRERLRRFNLTIGPLMRIVLVKLGSREHALLITLHHIVSDGWSIGVLIRELGVIYSAYVEKRPSPLPDLPVQYVDYSIWQRRYLDEDVLRGQLSYWRERLAGAPALLELPTDRPRPPAASFKGSAFRFQLPMGLVRALEEIGRGEGATLFMVILAAYQLLLFRWSGQRDVVVGSPIAGRRSRDIEGLIGLFINTLILRVEVTEELTFRELLARVREVTLGAYEHQDTPFEVIVRELKPTLTVSQAPIFQVMLALQNYPEEELRMAGLTGHLDELTCVTTHFDLTLYLYGHADGYLGTFEYATDLFDPGTIQRISENWRVLLDGIVADPECPIQNLRLQSAEVACAAR